MRSLIEYGLILLVSLLSDAAPAANTYHPEFRAYGVIEHTLTLSQAQWVLEGVQCMGIEDLDSRKIEWFLADSMLSLEDGEWTHNAGAALHSGDITTIFIRRLLSFYPPVWRHEGIHAGLYQRGDLTEGHHSLRHYYCEEPPNAYGNQN